MVLTSTPEPALGPADRAERQRWAWWPLLPLYPYGRRRTLVRELIPGQVWSFEQLQGVWYVAVPIRMTVVRVQEGLLLHAPVAPTAEVLEKLRELEAIHGPVRSIVLPTASGLEHKLPVPAMARAFPHAEVWVAPGQWSFPLRLPSSWLGFPRQRTRVLLEDGVPHGEELDWIPLGPLDLGLGTFMEVACFHRTCGALLITDALVAIPPEPPEIFSLDPTPLLFHARERGDEPLQDSPEARRKGWQRVVLFANYLRPEPLTVPKLAEIFEARHGPRLPQGNRPISAFTRFAGRKTGSGTSNSWPPDRAANCRWRQWWNGWCFRAIGTCWWPGSGNWPDGRTCAGWCPPTTRLP